MRWYVRKNYLTWVKASGKNNGTPNLVCEKSAAVIVVVVDYVTFLVVEKVGIMYFLPERTCFSGRDNRGALSDMQCYRKL